MIKDLCIKDIPLEEKAIREVVAILGDNWDEEVFQGWLDDSDPYIYYIEEDGYFSWTDLDEVDFEPENIYTYEEFLDKFDLTLDVPEPLEEVIPEKKRLTLPDSISESRKDLQIILLKEDIQELEEMLDLQEETIKTLEQENRDYLVLLQYLQQRLDKFIKETN